MPVQGVLACNPHVSVSQTSSTTTREGNNECLTEMEKNIKRTCKMSPLRLECHNQVIWYFIVIFYLIISSAITHVENLIEF